MSSPESVIAAALQRKKTLASAIDTKRARENERIATIKSLRDNAGTDLLLAFKNPSVASAIDRIIAKKVGAGNITDCILVRGVSQMGWRCYDEDEMPNLKPLFETFGALLLEETDSVRNTWNEVAREWSKERYQGHVLLWVGPHYTMFPGSSSHLGLFWKIG
jgi:hypothetical protein